MAEHTIPALDDISASNAYRHAFPAAELVPVAAGALWDAAGAATPHAAGALPEGPQSYVVVTPGSVQLRRLDLAKHERSFEREHDRRGKRIAAAVAHTQHAQAAEAIQLLHDAGMLAEPPDSDPLKPPSPKSEITAWSPQSRANMVRRLASLDYAPLISQGVPAMVTLTMPGEWQSVTPTGKHFKRMIEAFKVRWFRDWGSPITGVWKLELQRRGAPHLHIFTVPPAFTKSRQGMVFREWLSYVWADVVKHPDPVQRLNHERAGTAVDYRAGLSASDPRKVAIYFTKHGVMAGKEYQHTVPDLWRAPGAGPGRFWGFWGLHPAESSVPLTAQQAIAFSRVLRRHYRAQQGVRIASVWRVNTSTGQVSRRNVRRRLRRLNSTYGFICVNDGPGLVLQLADVLRKDAVDPVVPVPYSRELLVSNDRELLCLRLAYLRQLRASRVDGRQHHALALLRS